MTSRLNDEELNKVSGGTVIYQGVELDPEKKVSEIAEEVEPLMINKNILILYGFWDLTVQEMIDKFGEENVQKFIDLYSDSK